MPTPRKGESKQKFISRCMAFAELRSKSPRQRAGECYGIWSEHHPGDTSEKSAACKCGGSCQKCQETAAQAVLTPNDVTRKATTHHPLNLSKRFRAVMQQFSDGTLEAAGHKVTDRKQALAIAFREAREARRSHKALYGSHAYTRKSSFFSDCPRDDKGHCTSGGGSSGSGSAPRPAPKQRIFERGTQVAKTHYHKLAGALSALKSGKLDAEQAKARVVLMTDRAADAAGKNFVNRYRAFKERMAARHGADALDSPEWQAVLDTFKNGRNQAMDWARNMGSDARKAIEVFQAKGAFPRGAANELARDSDDLAEFHLQFTRDLNTAVAAFEDAYPAGGTSHKSAMPSPQSSVAQSTGGALRPFPGTQKKAKRPQAVTNALKHPDKPGAGAKKRAHLGKRNREHAVMADFKRGKLRSGGSGKHVTSRQQAIAIAMSEGKKATKKAYEPDEDKALQKVPEHYDPVKDPIAVGDHVIARGALHKYQAGKGFYFKAKAGEKLHVVAEDQYGHVKVKNKAGQEAVIHRGELRKTTSGRGHRLPETTGKEEPYNRPPPAAAAHAGTCKPGQTARETGCTAAALRGGLTVKGWVTLEPSGTHVYIEDGTGKISKGPSHLAGKELRQLKGERVGQVHGERHPETRSSSAAGAAAAEPKKIPPAPPVSDAEMMDREGAGQRLAQAWLGSSASDKDLARLSGGEGNESVHVSRVGDRVALSVSGPGWEAVRKIYRDKDGHLAMNNESITVANKGKGLGTKVFARQVEALQKAGFARITSDLAGSKHDPEGLNGYYTWARMGYDGPIPAEARQRLPAQYRDAQSVQDLLAMPGGKEAWKEHGATFKGTFDLAPGSRSQRALHAYLQARGGNTARAAAGFTRKHIVKEGGKYRLLSKKKGPNGKRKNLGTYGSRAAALKRERQVEYFKHQKSHTRKSLCTGPLCVVAYDLPALAAVAGITQKRLPQRTGLLRPNRREDVRTDDQRMSATGILASSNRDRQGDIIECRGVDLTDHRANPIVLWDHGKRVDVPIGITETPEGEYTVRYLPTEDVLVQTTFFADTPFSRQIYALIREGIIRANSIAVKDLDVEPLEPDPEQGHYVRRDDAGRKIPFKHILKSSLAEVTWTPLPANPDAVMSLLARGKIMSDGFAAQPLDPIIRKGLAAHVGWLTRK